MPGFYEILAEFWNEVPEPRYCFYLGNTAMHNLAIIGRNNDGPMLHVVHSKIDQQKVSITRLTPKADQVQWVQQSRAGRVVLLHNLHAGVKVILPTEITRMERFRPMFNDSLLIPVTDPPFEVSQHLPNNLADLAILLTPREDLG